MRALLTSLWLACATLGGCALSVPENYFGCSMDSECPPGQFCNGDRCASQRSTIDASVDTGPRVDAGNDASRVVDAAIDVGSDVGQDASIDTGPSIDSSIDMGPTSVDAGSDTGVDVGTDAGHDASTWSPTGTYSDSPAPSYVCAINDFNVGSWAFDDDGASLTVSDPNADIPCAMSGATARTNGSFDVSCGHSAGGCSATYRLMGAFTGDNTWTATFTASYVGTGNACGAAPDNCTLHTFPSVMGTRL